METWLNETKKPRSLLAISVKADEFVKAFDKRRKHDYSESLYDYQTFLPEGWTGRWLKAKDGSDALYMITPPDWKEGDSLSDSLLLGGGTLVEAKGEML